MWPVQRLRWSHLLLIVVALARWSRGATTASSSCATSQCLPLTFRGGSSPTTATATATATATCSSSALPRTSIPRSRGKHALSLRHRLFPPWNVSPQIDERGFLKSLYRALPGEWESEVKLRTSHELSTTCCKIRQVPGDGNCLFHSISLCLRHAINGSHWILDGSDSLEELYGYSHDLRQQAVRCLASKSKRLFLQGRESLRASELVHAAASQYHLTSEEYCASMSQPSVWGGGPEIVALCNLLQRPIHVYELATTTTTTITTTTTATTKSSIHSAELDTAAPPPRGGLRSSSPSFILRRMACFGSPKFDHRRPLHILSADSRFPDVPPGQQLSSGNHFLAVFPTTRSNSKRKKLRGGGSAAPSDCDDDFDDNDDFNEECEYGCHSGDMDSKDHSTIHIHADDCKDLETPSDSAGHLVSQWIRWWAGWWRQSFQK